MFGNLPYLALQQYWYIIVSLLGAILVFLFFVQGGQTFIFSIGKSPVERTIIVNSLGRKWEFTFTTLVTFGGAFFASFPLFYATSFGGAYWVWMAILFAFVIQAVSYEFRTKANNFLGQKVFEGFLFVNGLLGTFLVGVAVATFFSGSQFSLDEMNRVIWANDTRGLEAAFNLFNLSLGFTVFFLARVLGLLYFMNTIDNENIITRSRKALLRNAIPFVGFFLIFAIWLMLREGYAVNPDTGEVFMESFKYAHNLLAMPLVMWMFLGGVVMVLGGIALSLLKNSSHGIWLTGPGTVLVVFSLFLLAGFNNTAFYPSAHDLQSSLTIQNASSSQYTLVALSWVSLSIPFVLAYIVFAWRALNKKKIDEKEMQEEHHVY
ncbi:MAG: cytochrome d ubiquinol oxidase subunit II [Bacteroidetes bacterium]|nr:MAG: cytochrome d ubiquinol oxidase subunit II [Bacteroidota bacterium]